MESLVIHVITAAGVFISCVLSAISLFLARSGSPKRQAYLEHGKHLAKIAVAYGRARGGTALEVRRHCLGAFVLADEREDGRRDFTDAQAAVFVDAELAQP